MQKILLVVPNFRWRDADGNILWHYFPYNLCMIAAVIEKKYIVKIIDANKANLSQEEFAEIIAKEDPDIVGFSVLMDYFGKTAHIVAEIVKNYNKQIITVIGGVYATTNISKVMKDDNIDYLIAGEGEYAFSALLDNIFADKSTMNIKGIYERAVEKTTDTELTERITDLDALPMPAYHLLDFEDYANTVDRNDVGRPPELPYARILTSRGCLFNCCFCQVKHINGKEFIARSADNVLEEIDWLKEKYGIRSVLFDDDNFFTDRARAVEIIEGMIERKITWKIMNVAVFFLDDELLELIKKSDCQYICISVESASERVLKEIIHKPINLEQVKTVVQKIKELDIYIAANFVVGFPGETWQEIMTTIKFAEELNVDYVKIGSAVPLPKTELYDMSVACNYIAPDYDSENIDWRRGWINTDEFTADDLTILRAYSWDRINFNSLEKIQKTIKMMDITEEELREIRKNTRKKAIEILRL